MEGVNWSEVGAQTAIIGLIGGAISRLLWTKIESKIDKATVRLEKDLKKELSDTKKQVYMDINGLGQKVQEFNIELALQKQTDIRHDKELEEIRGRHLALDTRFNEMVEKIFIKIEELKDLVITKYIK